MNACLKPKLREEEMKRSVLMMSWAMVPVMLASVDGATKQRLSKESSSIANGRYLVAIAGCNDCHTRGYGLSDGNIPEKEWLKGDDLGWNGAWGTTYPVNLRLLASTMSEKTWMQTVKNAKARPPMPWYALRDMHDDDFRDIYRYLRHLGPAGAQAPSFVPPNRQPAGPVVRYPQ
jgi:mono/diheme cytochrome c family protein